MNWTRSGHAAGGKSWRMRLGRPAMAEKESAGSAHAPALAVCWKDARQMHDARGLLGRKQKVRCSRKLPRERKRAPLTLIYPSNPAALHTVVLLCRFRFLRSSGASKDFRHPSASKEECVLHCIFSCEILIVWSHLFLAWTIILLPSKNSHLNFF
jgi:hypothetical protein